MRLAWEWWCCCKHCFYCCCCSCWLTQPEHKYIQKVIIKFKVFRLIFLPFVILVDKSHTWFIKLLKSSPVSSKASYLKLRFWGKKRKMLRRHSASIDDYSRNASLCQAPLCQLDVVRRSPNNGSSFWKLNFWWDGRGIGWFGGSISAATW